MEELTIFLINLERRQDRLEAATRSLKEVGIIPPSHFTVFSAIDYKLVPCPEYWKSGGAAWGCRESHLSILRQCLNRQVEPIMVLEDDIYLCPDFLSRWHTFLQEVPSDWDGLMVGGQHHQDPIVIKEGVVKCRNTQRTHAYIARGKFLRELYLQWSSPQQDHHIDWTLGEAQKKCKVYAPDPFLFGQSRSYSDIRGRVEADRLWRRPTGQEPLLLLDCNRETMEGLREYCVHTGYDRGEDGIDNGLRIAVQRIDRIPALIKWINDLQWEAVSVEGMVLGIWHPQLTDIELIKRCWSGPVHLVRSIEDALPYLSSCNRPDKTSMQAGA